MFTEAVTSALLLFLFNSVPQSIKNNCCVTWVSHTYYVSGPLPGTSKYWAGLPLQGSRVQCERTPSKQITKWWSLWYSLYYILWLMETVKKFDRASQGRSSDDEVWDDKDWTAFKRVGTLCAQTHLEHMTQGPEGNAMWLKARHTANIENNLKIHEEKVMIIKVYILIICILC